MNARQADSFAAFQRAIQCIARHPVLRDQELERTAVARLQEFVHTIRRLAAKQKYAELRSKELTLAEDRLKKEVRRLLDRVSAVADVIVDRGGRIFRAPNVRASTQDVIVVCRAFAEMAGPHEAAFISMDMPATFIADLLEAANALESAVADRVDIAADMSGATEGIKEAVSRGSAQLGVVDSIYGKFMTAGIRAEWEQAKRMGREHRPQRAPKRAPAPATQAPTEPIAIDALPAPKTLPIMFRLESILARFVGHKQSVENVTPDVSVSEIRRLPSRSSARS